MKVLVSGGTGLVGRYIVEELLAAGYSVIVGGRHAPLPRAFSRPVEFAPAVARSGQGPHRGLRRRLFLRARRFHHLPGKYRGGEGDDPETFKRLNLDGTVRLFEAAKRAGTRRCIFISSRAVYGDPPAGNHADGEHAGKADQPLRTGQARCRAQPGAPCRPRLCDRKPEADRRLRRACTPTNGTGCSTTTWRAADCRRAPEPKFTAATSARRCG
jgi:nucleoside-diphosphate-sugar epimerase